MRDHVAALGGADHRRREREREQRLEQLGRGLVLVTRELERFFRRERPGGDRLDDRLGLGAELELGPVRGESLDQRCRLHERVVGDARHRRVTRAAVHDQPEGRAHLLGARAEVERAAEELHPLACAFVQRVIRANRVRVVLAEPGEPEPLADLLVGASGEDEIARRLEALPRERCDRDRLRRDLALHVDRAAPPELAVANLARPGVELPVGGVGHDGVRVREQQQARPAAASRQARDEVRALRDLRVDLAANAVVAEIVAQQLGRLRLVAGRIDRVEPDQLLEKLRNLVAQRVSPPRSPGR